MQRFSSVAKESLFKRIVIDFDCIVDTDVGLIRLISSEYMDDDIFNRSLVQGNLLDIIRILYNRTEVNPLYDFANEGVPKKDLDDYYSQFIIDMKSKVLSLSVSNDFFKFIKSLYREGDIEIQILCRDELEAKLLNTDDFAREYAKVVIEDNNTWFGNATQFFFKYITDPRLMKYTYILRTYYFSTHRLNFNEDRSDLLDLDIIKRLIYNKSEIEIIDLYNHEMLKETHDGNDNS